MTPGDADRFCAALTAVSEIFERELSDAAQTLWFDALGDLELDACLRAFEQAAKTKTFMPRPAEIRAIATGQGSDPELVTEAAWQAYRDLALREGGYASPTVSNPALAETILAVFGSWELACWTELTPEMWASKRKEFGRVYRLMAERGETAPTKLVGYCERTNTENGFAGAATAALPAGERKQLSPLTVGRRIDITAEEHAQRVTSVQRGLADAIDRRDAATAPTDVAPVTSPTSRVV